MRLRTCKICGEEIDLSACGQTLAHLHIERDNGNQTKNERFLLCDNCTASLEVWIATKSLEKVLA